MYRTDKYDALASALMELVGMLNSPRVDDILLSEAGVALDRALFPLLVRIGAAKAISVADLAEQAGRDQSTVSRQTAKLEELGLIARRAGKSDARVREAIITAEGRRVVATLTQTRKRLWNEMLGDWSAADIQALARLNRKLADAVKTAIAQRLA